MQNTKIMCAVMLDTKVRRILLAGICGAAAAPSGAGSTAANAIAQWQTAAARRGALGRRSRACNDRRPVCSTQGPEIRTGMLVDGKPVQLTAGQVGRASGAAPVVRRGSWCGSRLMRWPAPGPDCAPGRASCAGDYHHHRLRAPGRLQHDRDEVGSGAVDYLVAQPRPGVTVARPPGHALRHSHRWRVATSAHRTCRAATRSCPPTSSPDPRSSAPTAPS
jgi:hypothetical protein